MGKEKRNVISDLVEGRDRPNEKEPSNKTPVVVGLDLSTACTGICVLNAKTGELIKLFHVKFNKKGSEEFWDKVKCLKESFDLEFDPNWDIKSVSVEEAAKRFTPGFSSADTIITLSKFNAIACYIMFVKHNVKPHYINVRSARSKIGIKLDYKDKSKTTKQKILKIVHDRNPNFPWLYRTVKGNVTLVKINEDMADAYVIAAAARIIFPEITR